MNTPRSWFVDTKWCKLDAYSSNAIQRNFETFGEFGFSPAGAGPRSTFETKEYFEGMKKAANRAASEEVKNIYNSRKTLGDDFYGEYLNARKTSKEIYVIAQNKLK